MLAARLPAAPHCSLPAARRHLRPAARAPPVARAAGGQREAFGPEPPEWMKVLEDAAEEDEDIAEMLRAGQGDPKRVEEQIRARFTEKRESVLRTPTGTEAPMRVVFREVDPWNVWIWAQVRSNLVEEDRETLGEVLKAWFIVGKLGGFNSSNLQVQRHVNQAATSVSNMRYSTEERDESACVFHAMGEPEFKDNWMRCWFDLGTSDELALDVLINTLSVFSKEHVAIQQLVVGGVNADWAQDVEAPRKQLLEEEMGLGLAGGAGPRRR